MPSVGNITDALVTLYWATFRPGTAPGDLGNDNLTVRLINDLLVRHERISGDPEKVFEAAADAVRMYAARRAVTGRART